MRVRTSVGLTSVTMAVAMLTLGACASPAIPDVEDLVESVTEFAPDIEVDLPEAEDTAATEGLSQEAIDSGYTIAKMPSGWPSDLPLPDGHPVTALRSGSNFSMIFDVSSVKAGEKVFAWYEQNGWTTDDDLEMDGVRVVTFGSPETNDYGPLRRVTVGLGMTDWPTGFQYSLQVQE